PTAGRAFPLTAGPRAASFRWLAVVVTSEVRPRSFAGGSVQGIARAVAAAGARDSPARLELHHGLGPASPRFRSAQDSAPPGARDEKGTRMFLHKLEIQGFKSFVDRTELQFGAGITGVIGPNGCGKTNVSDAIRWVMGEQSARQLRGDS